jgi:branched-chain amino acid aminotransferase
LYYYDNEILECSRANIFFVKDGRISTPKANVLKGITKSIVTDIINEKEIPFEEKRITPDKISSVDEIFITSTSKMVMPVVQIDNKIIGNGMPGEITKELSRQFSPAFANLQHDPGNK